MTGRGELYACLYIKEFPAQSLLRVRPQLRQRPCVVMDGDAPFRTVCSLNGHARRAGIVRGMSQAEVDTFTSVVLLFRSRGEEENTRGALLECASRISPRIEELMEAEMFACVLDISGTARLSGSPQKLAKALLQQVRNVGVSASIAISRNFHAAVCMARGMSRTGSVVIAQGEESRVLAPLPLSILQLSEEEAKTFERWGIRSLGALAALTEEPLIARMGQEGRRLRRLALGELPHLFVPKEPQFKLEEYQDLDHPVQDVDSLLFVIRLLLEKLMIRAAARVLALASVTLDSSLEDKTTYSHTIRSVLPSNDLHLWLKLIHLHLQSYPPQAAVLTLRLYADPEPTSKLQLGLFSPQLPEAVKLDVTLTKIRAIVGEDRVGRAVLKDTHQHDAFFMETFSVPSTSESADLSSTESFLAMRRFRHPLSLKVVIDKENLKAVFFQRKRYDVAFAYGPWRRGGDWWSSTPWEEEEWDVVARDQQGELLCCCIKRDRSGRAWQMVGIYD
ncbi:DNA polymerase Y family protein [Edaphobacter sp. HDX4]|uniref:DNA polymerase Y family protein n=1 Tax=Edaphobacter sp. HDX4 TaxID=2794064 RepID=UPI002FE5A2FE